MANVDEKTAVVAEREVYLLGEINSSTMRQIGAEVIRLHREKPKAPISLKLTSGGGDVEAVIAFCEVVLEKKIPLHVDVYFSADSAAILILCVGRLRRATSTSTFLFHEITKQSGAGVRFTGREFRSHADDLDHTSAVYRTIIARATRKHPDEIAKMMQENRRLSAQEAQKFGLIHKIIKL